MPVTEMYAFTHAQVEDLIRRTRHTSERDCVIALRGLSARAVLNGLQQVRANIVSRLRPGRILMERFLLVVGLDCRGD
jgi:hypothetical protein